MGDNSILSTPCMHQHGGELWWKVDLIGCVSSRWCWLIMYRSSHWGSFDLTRWVGLTICGLLSATQVTPVPAFQSNESGSYQTNLMFPFTSFASDDQRKHIDRKFLQPLYYWPITNFQTPIYWHIYLTGYRLPVVAYRYPYIPGIPEVKLPWIIVWIWSGDICTELGAASGIWGHEQTQEYASPIEHSLIITREVLGLTRSTDISLRWINDGRMAVHCLESGCIELFIRISLEP